MDTKINMTVVSLLLVLLGMAIQILINYLKKRGASISDPVTLPPNAVEFKFDKDKYVYKYMGESGVEFVLQNVPDKVQPYVLPFSADEEAKLSKLPKDGFNVLGPILANIVFYETDEIRHLITHFQKDVTLAFTLPETYLKQIKDKREKLQVEYDKGDIYIPSYLYIPQTEKNIQIWKPFQVYAVEKILNSEGKETGDLSVTITFKSWGDQRITVVSALQIGFGPKR
ncbi:MAG: hypothetical protein ABI904_08780 [Chloroflexota bacterium]